MEVAFQAQRETLMQAVEEPRERWVEVMNDFTARYEGWLVSLDIFSEETSWVHSEIVNLPLLGVSADRTVDEGTVTITVARPPSRHLTRTILHVRRVYSQQSYDGAAAALLIEASDGTKALLQVRSATRAD